MIAADHGPASAAIIGEMNRDAVKWVFYALAGLTLAGGGVSLSYLVARRMETKPTHDLTFVVDSLGKNGIEANARTISQARAEVLICAHQIGSKSVLKALIEAKSK